MSDLEIIDIYENTNRDKSKKFIDDVDSSLRIKIDSKREIKDIEWIEKMEEIIPYIDNILRSPNRFIVNEEEIVKIELARKITVDSIKHLSKNTNLIQSIDKKTGDVTPSKILNINKEESYNTYENRLIYTLIQNMRTFYEQRLQNFTGDSSYYDKVEFQYDGKTILGEEKVDIQLFFHSLDEKKSISSNISTDDIVTRIKKIKVQLDGFAGTELMQNLSKLNVQPVRSPIRKTNVILKNPNFQKAIELWNFIQSYSEDDYEIKRDIQNYLDTGELKNQFDQLFSFSYLIKQSLASNNNVVSTKRAISSMMKQLIESLLESDMSLTDANMKAIFMKELQQTRTQLKIRDEMISKVFQKELLNVQKEIDLALEILS